MFQEKFCKNQNLLAHKFKGSQAVYWHNTREMAKLITGGDLRAAAWKTVPQTSRYNNWRQGIATAVSWIGFKL